jgi:signal peptidase I
MNWKPNKWRAALLAFLAPPLGMLYVNRAKLAGVYFVASLAIGLTQFWLVATGSNSTSLLFLLLIVVAVAHAYLIAARAACISSRPWFSRWYGLLTAVIFFAVIVLLFRAFLFEPFHLPTQAMFPSIPKGSYVVVRKYGYGNYASYGIRLLRAEVSAPLTRGDALVFEYPQNRRISYIKRLIGLPGDHIVYTNKLLYVNDKPLPTTPLGAYGELEIAREASYKIANDHGAPANDFNVTIEPGHLFFLGDNRDNSRDSRFWGQVPFDHIVGKVILVLKDEKANAIVSGKQ